MQPFITGEAVVQRRDSQAPNHSKSVSNPSLGRPCAVPGSPCVADEDDQSNDFDGTNPQLRAVPSRTEPCRAVIVSNVSTCLHSAPCSATQCQGPTRPSHHHHDEPRQCEDHLNTAWLSLAQPRHIWAHKFSMTTSTPRAPRSKWTPPQAMTACCLW